MFRRKKKKITIPRDEHIQPTALVHATEIETRHKENHLQNIPAESNYFKESHRKERGLPKGLLWGIIGLAVLFAGGIFLSFSIGKEKVTGAIAAQANKLQAGVVDLQNLDPQSAAAEFAAADASAPNWGDISNVFISLFQGGGAAIKALGDVSSKLGTFSTTLINLQNDLLGFLVGENKGSFLGDLKSADTMLMSINADGNALQGVAQYLGGPSAVDGGAYLSLNAQLQGAQNFLDAFVPWLSNPTPHHMLVLFQNPSELRPAGGFLGSYADVTIASGTISNIALHDVADVDAGFTKNIIPPQPLQLENARFRPADANWFFDFPTSASETINYFEASNLYAASGTIFDGAVAVSPEIFGDLLSLTGPITLVDQSTTFTSANFMIQIQKIVQKGQATQSTYPKKVLSELANVMITKLASSTDDQKQALFGMALNWIQKKDAMFYFKNSTFENFAENYGAAGDVYELPQNFNGDYLAIVNTNILGDKSDLYTSQKINFDTEINADGTATDHLTINRVDTAPKNADWWYRTPNQDYLQIFTPQGIVLDFEGGGSSKKITASVNYLAKGYATDTLVAAIAAATQNDFIYPAVTTHSESGKQVFATWTTTKPGSSSSIEFDYSHRLFQIPSPGEEYQFVFDKQPGTQGTYTFTINAPLGYVFEENGLASYVYQSNDPPGRVIINLTLKPLQE